MKYLSQEKKKKIVRDFLLFSILTVQRKISKNVSKIQKKRYRLPILALITSKNNFWNFKFKIQSSNSTSLVVKILSFMQLYFFIQTKRKIQSRKNY